LYRSGVFPGTGSRMHDDERPRFRGVLLDLFGTLVPARPRRARSPHLHEMARILGIDPRRFEDDWSGSFEQRVLGRLGPLPETIRQLAARQGADPSEEVLERAVDARLAFTRGSLDACGPVLPALDALRAAGVRLAVVSDASEEAALLWPTSALGARIPVATFSCREGFCKPDPRIYARTLERLGLRAEECAFVGDGGSRELTGATAVGLTAFLYRFPEDLGGEDPRYEPDHDWKGVPLRDIGQLLAVVR
jgi:putative hydrolase of the HAD superfamily